MAAELLNCPFCGCEPELSTYREANKLWYEVECLSDTCEHRPSICGHRTEEDAIKAWNRRPDTGATTAQQLKAEIAAFENSLTRAINNGNMVAVHTILNNMRQLSAV